MVGMVRFELTASCSQSRRANQTTLHPGTKRIIVNHFGNFGKTISQQLVIYHFSDFVWQNTSTHHDMLIRL